MTFQAILLALTLAGGGERTLQIDVVELVAGREVPGLEEHALEHAGHRYLFASEASRRAFEADPARYEVQMGGACARMGPLSGLGSTELFAVYDGRVYLFASEGCRAGFLREPDRLLERPDPVPESNPETARRGAELIATAVGAMGGAERVDGVRSLRLGWEGTAESGERELRRARTTTLLFPAGLRTDSTWGDRNYVRVVTPDDAFFDEDGEVRDMQPQQIAAMIKERSRIPLVVMRARDRSDFVAVASGSSVVGEREVDLVTAAFGGATATLAVDAENGRILGMTFRGRGPDARFGTLTRTYGDFREVGGLTLPASESVRFDGEEVASMAIDWTSLEVDAELPPELFAR